MWLQFTLGQVVNQGHCQPFRESMSLSTIFMYSCNIGLYSYKNDYSISLA